MKKRGRIMEKQSLIICGKLFDGIKDELQENMEILDVYKRQSFSLLRFFG